MYSKLENDANDMYLGDTTATTTWEVHEEPHHNMQIACYIKNEEDVNKNIMIQMGMFKLTSKNAAN